MIEWSLNPSATTQQGDLRIGIVSVIQDYVREVVRKRVGKYTEGSSSDHPMRLTVADALHVYDKAVREVIGKEQQVSTGCGSLRSFVAAPKRGGYARCLGRHLSRIAFRHAVMNDTASSSRSASLHAAPRFAVIMT